MTIIYRTSGAWGAGKGSNLTPAEVDGNFWDIAQRLENLETGAVSAVNQIESITLVGTQLTFTMEDATQFGPFTVPVAKFSWQGIWQPETLYSELDLIFASGEGLFMVLQDHTSDTVFDPNAIGEDSQPLYFQLFGVDFLSFVDLNDVEFDTYTDHEAEDVVVKNDGTGLTFRRREHVLQFHFFGVPTSNQVVHREIVQDYLRIEENFGFTARIWNGVQATNPVDYDVRVNGMSIGSITVSPLADDIVGAVVTETDLAPGDRIEIVAPASPDATHANFTFSAVLVRIPTFVP